MYSIDDKARTAFLGKKLRQIRKLQNLTQLDLARQVGITNGQISTIERGVSSPSLSTLHRIARALNVPIPEFFEDTREREVTIVRRGEGQKLSGSGAPFRGELLCAKPGPGGFHVIAVEIPRSASEDLISLPDAYYLHVLAGKAEVEIQGDRFLLDPWDSAYVKTPEAHGLWNAGAGDLRVLVVSISAWVPEPRSRLARRG